MVNSPDATTSASAARDARRINRHTSKRLFNAIIIGGILLRLVVLIAASPFNADDHLEVIRWVADHHTLPRGDLLAQSHHPPLYYLLMTPIWIALGGPRSAADGAGHALDVTATIANNPAIIAMHIASFVMSSATLLVLARMIDRTCDRFRSGASRCACIAFAAFLPQFVMFGSFISNDTLTMLIGALLFNATLALIDRPTLRRIVIAGVWCGLGLLTKGTFLLSGFALIPIVWSAVKSQRSRRDELNEDAQRKQELISLRASRFSWSLRDRFSPMRAVMIFTAIFIAIGCEKYVDNAIRVGRPLVHNLDAHPDWAAAQGPVWRGWKTAVDVNVMKLIREPILQPKNPFSYPLLMYGTFWYPHIPDSSFRASIRGYDWVGSLLYAAAIVPTAVFLFGCIRAVLLSLYSGRGGERVCVQPNREQSRRSTTPPSQPLPEYRDRGRNRSPRCCCFSRTSPLSSARGSSSMRGPVFNRDFVSNQWGRHFFCLRLALMRCDIARFFGGSSISRPGRRSRSACSTS